MDARVRWACAALALSLVTGVPATAAPTPTLALRPTAQYKITLPKDAPLRKQVGALRIDTWNPVTMTPYEDNTHLYFTVTNTGSTARTLEHRSFNNLRVDGFPNLNVTIHRHFGEGGNADDASIVIPAGDTRRLVFTMERFLTQRDTTSNVPFTFRSVEDDVTATITLRITTRWFSGALENNKSAYIAGRVTNAAGKPIAGARVSAGLFAMTNVRSTTTDAAGRYRLGVLSMPEVRKLLGPRPLPYGKLAYFVSIDAPGHATADRTISGPNTGSTVTVNARLAPLSTLQYQQVGSYASNGTLAYWWLDFAGDRIIAVQGQHPPVTQRSGHIVAIDLRGREVWRQSTGGQCWGFDISDDKALVAAGCDDGFVYVNRVNDGTLLYKRKTGDRPGQGVVNAVAFSPDGRYLAVDGTGGQGGFSVLYAGTGDVAWTSAEFTQRPTEQWAYKLQWTADSTRLVAGDNGLLTSFTATGALEWRRVIGSVPFVLDFDTAGNVYVGTKDNVLQSFTAAGEPRWFQTLAQCPQMGRAAFGSAAGYLVMPTFSGLLQAYDFSGRRLWQHVMPSQKVNWGPGNWVSGVGHNAFSSTPDGTLMAIATRGYETTVYDRNGNLRWYHRATARKDFKGEDPESHGSMTGGQSVAITADGKTIAVGYADSVIRVFQRK